MDMLLIICTVLGGASAVWFFWDKIVANTYRFTNFFKREKDVSILSLSDDEFKLINKLVKQGRIEKYIPISKKELQTCNSLVNSNILKKLPDSSFVPTRKWKKRLHSISDT